MLKVSLWNVVIKNSESQMCQTNNKGNNYVLTFNIITNSNEEPPDDDEPPALVDVAMMEVEDLIWSHIINL